MRGPPPEASLNDSWVRVSLVAVLCFAILPFLDPGCAAADVKPASEDRELENNLSSYLTPLIGSYGVAVVNLDDGRFAAFNANTEFPTASMFKLLVMYKVFQTLRQGLLSPFDIVTIQASDAVQDEPSLGLPAGVTPTVAEAVKKMVAVSSNAATSALVRQIGGWTEVESAAKELGMSRTHSVDGDLWSTPRDLAHFFQLLDSRSLVDSWSSQQMINLLLLQVNNDRIPALLPPDTAIAHKTGELDDARNDGGIVYGPGGKYVIVMMSRGGVPDDEVQVLAAISQMVYDRYGK